MNPHRPHRQPSRRLNALCIVWLLSVAFSANAESLRSQLTHLAKQNRIAVEGLGYLGAEPSRPVEGNLAQQIKGLLANYNYMSVGADQRIERLIITSPKSFTPKSRLNGTVKTQRLGEHHQVDATVSGPNGEEVSVSLLVDTGATALVLPESMIGQLGFDPVRLRPTQSQTAGGVVPTKLGRLKSVKVGDVVAENVQVSFVSDQRLRGVKLLGMSFLNQFRFSLDDANNELSLQPK